MTDYRSRSQSRKIITTHDTRQRLSKAGLAFIEVAKEWFVTHDVFTA
jgi:hypothetical protein